MWLVATILNFAALERHEPREAEYLVSVSELVTGELTPPNGIKRYVKICHW